MNKLNFNYRDGLVRIGILAIEHALRFEPNESTRQVVEKRLSDLRNSNLAEAPQIIHEHDSKAKAGQITYSKENLFIGATVELLRLATTKKQSFGAILNAVLIKCWDAGNFVGHGNAELQTEMRWQEQELHPLIEQLHKNSWKAA
jgi:hypothetical protein